MDTPNMQHHASYRLNGGWGQPNREMLAVFIVAIVGGLAGIRLAGLIGFALAMVVTLPLYAPMYTKQKVAGVNMIQFWRDSRQIRRRGGVLFAHELSDALLEYDEESHSLQPVKQTSELPLTILSFKPSGQNYRISLLRIKTKGVDDVIGIVRFGGASSIVNAESALRWYRDRRIVDAYKSAVGTTMLDVSFSQFIMRRPADPTEQVEHTNARWHADFIDPPEGSPEAGVVEQARIEADYIYADGDAFQMGVAFRMEFPKEWRNKDLNRLTEPEVRSVDLMKVIDTFIANVRGVTDRADRATLFQLNELAFLLYNANIEDLIPFYAQMREDIERDGEGGFKQLEDAPTLSRGPFPSHISLAHDHLLTNRTYHSTVLVTKKNPGDYNAGYLDTLFQMPGPFVFSRVIHTLDYAKSVKTAQRKRTVGTFLTSMLRFGRSDDPDVDLSGAEREETAREQHHRMYYSKSRATLSRIQVTVEGSSAAEAQTAAHTAISWLQQHSMTAVQQLGMHEHWQHEPLLMHLCAGHEM